MDARIDALKAKAKSAKADAEIEYKKQIEKLDEKHASVRAQLDKLAQKGGEVWREIKAGAEQAFVELQGAIDAVADRLET